MPGLENVLVIGSGGREHALAWKLAQSPHVGSVNVAPGNAGTDSEEKISNVAIKAEDITSIGQYVEVHKPDLVVVGPEAPLAAGLVDHLRADKGFDRVFGASRFAAMLEAHKGFSHRVMEWAGIPQAESLYFNNKAHALSAIDSMMNDKGVVIKYPGLAAGKGVVVCDTAAEARSAIEEIWANDKYTNEVLISERLSGQEFSVFAYVTRSGEVVVMPYSSQDHKPIGEGDTGANTGGMGAYAPAPIATHDRVMHVAAQMFKPVVQQMAEMGMPYEGFLYGGFMMTERGPKVIEWNVRMGDPETQPLMMLLAGDMYEHIQAALDGTLRQEDVSMNDGAACTVVMASGGYPGSYEKGHTITGIDAANAMPDVQVFHAGTKRGDGGEILTNGGRVLGVTGLASTIEDAVAAAYRGVDVINFDGAYVRRDIGQKALQ